MGDMETGSAIAILLSMVAIFTSGFTVGLLAERHRASRE
jgi:hypothetical protein